MKRRSQLFFIAAFSLLTQASAHAGAESHGGQVVFCPGSAPEMLDYYQATLPTESGGIPTLVDMSKMSEQDILDFFKARLYDSELWNSYSRALKILGPVESWLEVNPQPVSDSDPAFLLPPNCNLAQLAVRQDSTMYVDSTILKVISPAQRGILMAHEALYYIAQENGLTSSVEIRDVIRSLLLKTEDVVELSKAVHEMGNKFFWWEALSSQNNYYEEEKVGKIAVFTLSYDPMIDGKTLKYSLGYFVNPNSNELPIFASGAVDCSVKPCRTISGPVDCTLTQIFWTTSRPQSASLDLTCRSLGISGQLSNFPTH